VRKLVATALAAWLLCVTAHPAAAAVNVQRSGQENPMVEVARSVLYGGLAGLMVGGAIAWASESDHAGDFVRWGFAGGTMIGLGFGLYYVTSRPQAMIEVEDGETRLGLALPEPAPGGARLTVVRASF
jgi:hypothetical protein